MLLTNVSNERVCFKIKTTAPKRYCVTPNLGVIGPHQSVQISTALKPFEFNPDGKHQNKFMVQFMFAPDGEINQDTLWKEAALSQVMKRKLNCVFTLLDEDLDNATTVVNKADPMSSQKPVSPPTNKVSLEFNCLTVYTVQFQSALFKFFNC